MESTYAHTHTHFIIKRVERLFDVIICKTAADSNRFKQYSYTIKMKLFRIFAIFCAIIVYVCARNVPGGEFIENCSSYLKYIRFCDLELNLIG